MSAARQTLALSVDFSGDSIALTAKIQDYASSPEGVTSYGAGTTGISNLSSVRVAGGSQTINLRDLASSWYVMSANPFSTGPTGPDADNHCYIFIQPSVSGRVLWTTRMTGYTGSGLGTLSLNETTDGLFLSIPFYEARAISSVRQLNSRSLLGELRFNKNSNTGKWDVLPQNGTTQYSLETQGSYVTKALVSGKWTPVYDPVAFNTDSSQTSAGTSIFNWTGTRAFEFNNQNAVVLSPSKGVIELWPSMAIGSYFLTAEDPGGEIYTWGISISSTGLIKTTKHTPGDSTQPTLTLRMDRDRGEWVGIYSRPGGARRFLYGVILSPGAEADSFAQGWLEAGVVPAVQTGAWWIAR